MDIRTGIDVEEIVKVKRLMENERFLNRILGEREYAYYESKGFKPESIAGAWCAKEAFAKVLGTGFSDFALSEVEVLHNELGKPFYGLSENLTNHVAEEGLKLDLSITHTDTLAMAICVALKED